ncbi:MAG: ABC transporter permease [Thermoleophilia bacterium]|nr:ABC transporter permease [Thermoleophilia bacterium]
MTRYRDVALAVAWRMLHNSFTRPAVLLPSILFPLFFFTAFAGGLSRLEHAPGFDFRAGYTAFQFVYVLLQSAAFGGVFTGFAIARDFESGFARRLLLAAHRRSAIIAGYGLAALGRWLFTATVVFSVALLAGMEILGSPFELVALLFLAAIVNVACLLWAAGVAMRLRTMQAGPAMQVPVFFVLFLAPVYVPFDLLQGWIQAIARYNPTTYFLEAGRGFVAGAPAHVALAFGAAAALAALFALWARRGLASAERAG